MREGMTEAAMTIKNDCNKARYMASEIIEYFSPEPMDGQALSRIIIDSGRIAAKIMLISDMLDAIETAADTI